MWELGKSLGEIMKATERAVITAAFAHFKENKTKTAHSLKVDVRTVRYKLKLYQWKDLQKAKAELK